MDGWTAVQWMVTVDGWTDISLRRMHGTSGPLHTGWICGYQTAAARYTVRIGWISDSDDDDRESGPDGRAIQ